MLWLEHKAAGFITLFIFPAAGLYAVTLGLGCRKDQRSPASQLPGQGEKSRPIGEGIGWLDSYR